MTIINVHIPETLPERIVFKTITNTRNGNINTKSVNRISICPILPPKYPEIAPTVVPTKTIKNIPANPMVNDDLPAQSIRVKTSRPFVSVPSQCSLDGGKLIFMRSTRTISFVVIQGAKNDRMITIIKNMRLIIANLFLVNFLLAITHGEGLFFGVFGAETSLSVMITTRFPSLLQSNTRVYHTIQ